MSEVVYTKEEKKKRVLGIVGASSGNLVEWFDFYIYAVFAISADISIDCIRSKFLYAPHW